ncbi:MAG: metallophosphoesterase [Eubacteriales bacterium]
MKEINYRTQKPRKKKKALKFLAVAAALFVFIRIALYDGLTLKNYYLSSPLVEKNHTFVLITDLHSTFYGDNQERLTEKIARYSPEAVFLSGDIADDKRDFDGTAILLTQLSERYPCYYVTGNHECWVEYTDDIKSLIEECGVTVLCGKTIDFGDGIRLFGVDDPLFYPDGEFRSTLSAFQTDAEHYDILLSHRPEFADDYADLGFDLALSGHAHGGQVRLPLILNGLYAPNQGWFPRYAGGKYTFDGGITIVSRGLMLDDLPRIFNPPELVVITLEAE